MPRLVAQILLSVLMLAIASILYTVTAACTYELVGWNFDILVFLVAGLVTWLFIVVFWMLLWRRYVRWTHRRLQKTIASFFVVLFPAALAGWLTSPVVDESFGMFIAGATAILLWLVATVLIWRETVTERFERIRYFGDNALICPNCGYNLTGLTTCTCPECGSEYTLDELVRSQPTNEANQIERA